MKTPLARMATQCDQRVRVLAAEQDMTHNPIGLTRVWPHNLYPAYLATNKKLPR
jgi:hypothetical protein